MKKIFQNRVVAWAVLILAVALACFWGISRKEHFESKKTTELLEVKQYQWINDSAKLLSSQTEKTVEEYNTSWNSKYYSVVAVATLPRLNGWEMKDYAAALGEKWGLGAGDMLLLLVKDGDYYVALGDNVARNMTDTQQTKLKQAVEQPYYTGNYGEAVEAFFRQADVFYGQVGMSGGGSSQTSSGQVWTDAKAPRSSSGLHLGGVILLVIGVLVVWAIIDRFRYNRYQRRAATYVGGPTVAYYPIFWGRPARPASPARPAAPRTPTGSYRSGSRPTAAPKPASRPSSTARPASRPTAAHKPTGANRPGGSFGKTGFGGGKR